MFCDDILGVCVDIGHKKTAIGYIGDDCPRYSTSSLYGRLKTSPQGMDIEYPPGEEDQGFRTLFGESLTSKYQGVSYESILTNESGRLMVKCSWGSGEV